MCSSSEVCSTSDSGESFAVVSDSDSSESCCMGLSSKESSSSGSSNSCLSEFLESQLSKISGSSLSK